MAQFRNNVLDDFSQFAEDHFCDRPFFGCIYGSHASQQAKDSSDIDVFFATQHICPEDKSATQSFITAYHRANNLPLDEEVPYENKLVVDFDDVNKAVNLAGLETQEDGKIVVPPVVKKKDFLGSIQVRHRLIFNALTTPHIAFGSDIESLTIFRDKAEKNLIKLAINLISRDVEENIEDLLNALLMGPNGEEGEMFLGYKKNHLVVEYLRSLLRYQLIKAA